MLTTNEEKIAYCIGADMARQVLGFGENLSSEALVAGMNDMLAQQELQLPPEVIQRTLQEFHQRMQEKAKNHMEGLAKTNMDEAVAFLDANKAKDGIETTESGLQYKVWTEGEGESPAAEAKVKVHYEGKLANGTVFDSSYKRGEPAAFALNQVIKGWGEGLQLMKVGGISEFYIHPDLGYGTQGAGQVIPPNALLTFRVELLEIEA